MGKAKSPVVPDPDYKVDFKDGDELVDEEDLCFSGSVKAHIILVKNPPLAQIFSFMLHVIS